MPTLYIHAGMPKTGTTTLQSFLYNNRTLLAERFKIYYPATGVNPQRGGTHQELFPVTPKIWNQLRKELSAFPSCDVVVSEEGIYGNAFRGFEPCHLDIVREILPSYDVKIILYLRRLDDYLKSLFNELTRLGLFLKKPSYAEFIANKNVSLTMSKRLSIATELVGKDNLLFRFYDKKIMKGGDIIADFFDLLGRKKPGGMSSPSITNPSMPSQALPFLAANLLPLPFDNPLRREIIELLHKAYVFPQGSGVGDEYLAEFEEEIDKLSAYVPGYKELFTARKLSFSFPEVDVKSPQILFIASLLYALLIRQGNYAAEPHDADNEYLNSILTSRSWRYTEPLRKLGGALRKLFISTAHSGS